MGKSQENGILEILSSFEEELNLKLQESKSEVERIKYYEDFLIKGIKKSEISGVFVTQKKDVNGNISYHIYYQSPSNEILSKDYQGNIRVNEKWSQVIGENIDFDSTMDINNKEKGRLKGISEKANQEEIKKELANKEQNRDKQEEIQDDEEKEEQIEEELQEDGQDLEISKYRKIKDKSLTERMPEVFENSEENGIAFSNKLNRFVMIEKVNGKYQLNEKIEPAQMTWKTVISIDEKGESIERKVPHSLMRVPNDLEKEVAVTIGDYGEIDIETVQITPCQERVARQVRTEPEGIEDEERKQITDTINTEGRQLPDDLAHKQKELEEKYNVKVTNIYELQELDIEKLIRIGAQSAHMSVESFEEYVKKADGKTLQEKIEKANEEIEEEYNGHKRPR